MFAKATPSISWYEPRWSYASRMWREFLTALNWRSLGRIIVVATVACAAIVAGVKWAVPQLAVPNLWPVLFALPGLLLYLAAQFGLLTLIPPFVSVCAKWIVVQHGQSATLIRRADVTAIRLIFHADNRVRLRVRHVRKSNVRWRTIGVPPTVNFDQLVELLPMTPIVRDARSRNLPAPAVAC